MKKNSHTSDFRKVFINGVWMAAGLYVAKTAFRLLLKENVKDKVVLITGGSRGLGLIMARQLADQQAKVVICARSHEELQKAVEYTVNEIL